MKKKRLALAMLAALTDKPDIAHPAISETPESLIYPFYPVGVKHIDKDTGTEVTDFNIYLSPLGEWGSA